MLSTVSWPFFLLASEEAKGPNQSPSAFSILRLVSGRVLNSGLKVAAKLSRMKTSLFEIGQTSLSGRVPWLNK